MAVTLTDAQREKLRGPIAVRTLIDFYLDSGRYSFWDGDGHWNYDGTRYLAAGAFASISPISLGKDLGAEGLEAVLDGTRMLEGAELDPNDVAAVLGSIEAEQYHLRRTTVRWAFFSVDAGEYGELVLVLSRHRGLIDQMRQEERKADDGYSSFQALVAAIESVARLYGKRGGRLRTNEDQQEIWPGDTFFKFTPSSVEQQGTLSWGHKKGQPDGGRSITWPRLGWQYRHF